jgi:hypothetical protein
MQAAFGLHWFNRILICGLVTLAMLPAGATPVTAVSKVEVLGAFSRVTHTGDDAFGYTVQLWKEGDRIFGLFLVYTGAPADPPTGILEDVKFDPRTRQLSFSTRVTTGLVYSQKYRGVPSRDRFKFVGVLTRRQLTGTLSHIDDLFPEERSTSKRIRLRWSAFSTEIMTPPPVSYSAWKTEADEVLQRRGPKW